MADYVTSTSLTGTCSCCGGETPCECALLIPPFSSPYADYATAEGVVSDPLQVSNCIAYQAGDLTDLTSFGATFDATTFDADATWSTSVALFGPVWISFSGKSGAVLTITNTSGATHLTVILYQCDGTIVDSWLDSTSAIATSGLPADGVYYFRITPTGGPPPFTTTFTSASFTVTSSDVWWINPVIAQWDDSGTTRKLWACPKLLLPPLTEISGDWYADCAAADAVLTSSAVSNCLGYVSTPVVLDSFTATGDLDLSSETHTAGADNQAGQTMWGCVNVVDGDTLSVDFDATETVTNPNPGLANVSVDIYDGDGVSIYSNIFYFTGSTTDTASVSVPYTGRYTVSISISTRSGDAAGETAELDAQISSSGTITANEIQGIYDVGLDCGGRLNCGDSCP